MFLQKQLTSSTGNLWDHTLIIMGIVRLAQWRLGGSWLRCLGEDVNETSAVSTPSLGAHYKLPKFE